MRRFWVPFGHGYDVDGNGVLSDPEITSGGLRWSNVDALTADDLRHCRSLVLLGEPGMGGCRTDQATCIEPTCRRCATNTTPPDVQRRLAP